ncbi:hypothetical protein PINS_up009249 [Pythium insidiosum]|nr:hypothetical protein PINS_up009249 [Pythium insidiosum]
MTDALSEKQKRGFAGLCACLLPHVNDASTELQWSRTYLQLVVETFLGLPSSQYKAFLPMLTARHDALEEFALSSTSISKDGRVAPPPVILDKLDPAPFVALVVPATGDDGLESIDVPEKKKKEKGVLKGWHLLGKKTKKEEGNNAEEAHKGASPVTSPAVSLPTHQEVQEFQLTILKQLLWFTVKAVGYDARARTLLRVMVETMRLPWKVITVEEISIGRTLFAEATAMPMEKAAAKPSVWDWKRNVTIGAAAVTGGALLALTGGLAAPAIAASLTALGGAGVAIGTAVGSAAGVTATTILFGTAGAGVVGLKTDARTRGVQQFHFDLISAGDGMNVYICVSGWLDEDDPPQRGFRRAWGDSREYLRAFYRKTNPEKVDQADQVLDRYKGPGG